MSEYSRQYYVERFHEARQMAAAATDEKVAAIHLELAQRYALLAIRVKPDAGEADQPVPE